MTFPIIERAGRMWIRFRPMSNQRERLAHFYYLIKPQLNLQNLAVLDSICLGKGGESILVGIYVSRGLF
jgi:hypothetical protein